MLVDYDDSSDEDQHETKVTSLPKLSTPVTITPVTTATVIEKKKIKLMGFNKAKDSTTGSTSIFSCGEPLTKTTVIINATSSLNGKRKFKGDLSESEDCPTEPKYYKISE